MHITILTVGSRGDVQPFAALGVGLKRRGFGVRLATHSIFRELVEKQDLEFFPIEGNPKEILFSDAGKRMLGSGRQTIRFMREAVKAFEPFLERLAEESREACEGTDAVIFTPFTFFGYDLAKSLSIPAIATCLQPAVRTRQFPSPAFPQGVRLGGTYNLLTHIVSEYGFWRIVQPYLNKWRVKHLGLEPISVRKDRERRNAPIIHGYSEFVLPRPADWGDRGLVTGYWFLEPESDWSPPDQLIKFLDGGPPPVCVGFGSMPGREDIASMVIEALRISGQRGIFIKGWGAIDESNLPSTIFAADYVPFEWLFPRVSAVVHHGGSGTLAEGLRAGKPTVVCPTAGDQPFWGEVIHGLNAGPKPIAMKKLTADKLARAIRIAVESESIRKSAEDLGKKLSGEDGVANAVEIISERLKTVDQRK